LHLKKLYKKAGQQNKLHID